MISFCCKGWSVNRWDLFEFKYGKMCLLWVRECGLLADGYACCEWSTWESTRDKWTGSFAWPLSLVVLLSKFTYSTVSVVVRERKNVGSDTRQNELLVQLGNCHPLSCIGSLIMRTNSSHTDPSEGRGVHTRKVVTWLILPVVICLSQRLSHACLSINKFVLWNCEWLIKSVIVYLMLPCYMDNCGNSRANTCNKAPTSGRGVFIR